MKPVARIAWVVVPLALAAVVYPWFADAVAPSAPPSAEPTAVAVPQAAPASADAGAHARDAAREVASGEAVFDERTLEHPYSYSLDVQVVDRTGLPVVGAKVLLAPAGCRLDEVPQRTDDGGNLHVEWRGRADAMPMVIATTADEQDASMRPFTATAGSQGRLVLGGQRGGGGGGIQFFVSNLGGNSGQVSFAIDGKASGGSGVVDLGKVLSSVVLQQSSFANNPLFRTGLHPHAAFGDVQLRDPPSKPEGGQAAIQGQTLEFSFGSDGNGGIALGAPTRARTARAGGDPGAKTRLVGVVYGEDGKPVARCPVSWGTEVDRPKRRGETNPKGEFAFEDVPEGRLELRAGGNLAGLQHATVQTVKGQTVRQDLNLQRGIAVHGRVLGDGDKPVQGCRIEWVGRQVLWSDSATSQQDGSFWLTNLPGGDGQLLLWSNDDGARLPIAWLGVLPNSGEAVFRIDPAVVQGQLLLEPLLPQGIDRAAIEVRVFQEETGRGTTMTKLDGSNQFAIRGLPAGFYRVEVGGPGLGWVDAGRHFVDGKGAFDAGRVALLTPGTARLQLPPEALRPRAEGQTSLVEIYQRRREVDVRLEALRPELLAEPLPLAPGDYFVLWRLEGGVEGIAAFAVRAGQETVVACTQRRTPRPAPAPRSAAEPDSGAVPKRATKG